LFDKSLKKPTFSANRKRPVPEWLERSQTINFLNTTHATLEGSMSTAIAMGEPAMTAMLPMHDDAPVIPASRPQSRWDASWGKQEPSLASMTTAEGEELPNLQRQAKRSNLGASILLSAVEDYRRANGKDFESAKKFLFPEDKEGRDHLAWAIGLTRNMTEYHTRLTLDWLRPRWDTERKTRGEI
jgi:hypothetical protein